MNSVYQKSHARLLSLVIDLAGEAEFGDVVKDVSEWLAQYVPRLAAEIEKQLMDGTQRGATPVSHGVALPHLRIEGIEHSVLVLVRASAGIHIVFNDPLTHHLKEEQILNAVFFLFSPEDNPTQHLRVLAQIASRVDDRSFEEEWLAAKDEQELKEVLLHDERCLSLFIHHGQSTQLLIGCALRDVEIPEGCLVAILQRGGRSIAPKGDTVFQGKDRLTIIGDPAGLKALQDRYLDGI